MKPKCMRIHSRQMRIDATQCIHVFNLSRDAWILLPACIVMYVLSWRRDTRLRRRRRRKSWWRTRYNDICVTQIRQNVKIKQQVINSGAKHWILMLKNEERSQTALATFEKQQFSHINLFSIIFCLHFFFFVSLSTSWSHWIIINVSWNSARNSRLWIRKNLRLNYFFVRTCVADRVKTRRDWEQKKYSCAVCN